MRGLQDTALQLLLKDTKTETCINNRITIYYEKKSERCCSLLMLGILNLMRNWEKRHIRKLRNINGSNAYQERYITFDCAFVV